jgi:hypothetical protein
MASSPVATTVSLSMRLRRAMNVETRGIQSGMVKCAIELVLCPYALVLVQPRHKFHFRTRENADFL